MNTTGKILALTAVFLMPVPAANGQIAAASSSVSQKKPAANVQSANLERFIGLLNQALNADAYQELAELLFVPKDFETADADEEKQKKDIVLIGQMIEQTKTAGIKFKVRMTSPGKIRRFSETLFSIVPHNTIIIVDKNTVINDGRGQPIRGGKYKSSGYAVAISKNNGESWRFWNEVSRENFEKEFPAAASEIKLPALKKPYFLR